MEQNIVGWISKIQKDNTFIGWLINTSDISPRVAVIKVNGNYSKEVLCNQKRTCPQSYKEFKMNGFKFSLDNECVNCLQEKNTVVLIDKETNELIYSCSFHISKDELSKRMNEYAVKKIVTRDKLTLSESKKTKVDSNIKVFKGKLNSKFTNFKITGWLVQTNSTVVSYSEVCIKLADKYLFNAIADKHRNDLEKKGLNHGIGGFSLDIPIEIISQLPKVFKVELYAKDNDKVIDSVEYKNIELFSPRNVHEFLCYSMVNPVMYAPFTENHKRCFAFMENVASMLEKEISDQNQLVSVIMPVLNREDVVLDSIKSVLNQSYQNFELIIIDDYSTDNSVKIIKTIKDSRIKLLENKKNHGCSYSRNKGVKNSHGNYIFYLDSDNTWDSRYLKVMMGAFKKTFNSQALYCGQYLFRGNSDKCYAVRYGSFNRSLLENRNYIDLNCFCHTRKAFDAVGGFDEKLQRLVDYDLILRISDNFDVYSVPVVLSNYYLGKCDNAITLVKPLVALNNNSSSINKTDVSSNEFIKNDLLVSAIIPNYETIDDLEECIESLTKSGCSEIIVVDNNSSKLTIDRLDKLEQNKIIKLIKNKKNYGFTYAVNQGIKVASKNNDILLVNNDSVFTSNSIYEMKKAAYTLENVGLVVPRQVLYSGNGSITAHVPFANPAVDCDVNLSIHHFNIENVPLISNGKNIELSFAPFFCVYIKREVFDKAGELDAQHGRHYRSDRIYCDVIRHILGLKIYYVSSSIVYHKLQKATVNMKKNQSDDYKLIFIDNQWSEKERIENNFSRKAWE